MNTQEKQHMLMLPHEHMGRKFFLPVASFLLFHLFSKHIKVYADLFTLIHVSGNFCRINRIFFSNSHVLASRPAQSQESKP